jgi:hypothetical protein
MTAITAFGDSIPQIFLIKNKTVEAKGLADQQFSHGHDSVIENVKKTFITEVLFIAWLQTHLIPKNDQIQRNPNYDGPIILLVDGHAVHVTPRLIAYAGSQKITKRMNNETPKFGVRWSIVRAGFRFNPKDLLAA